MPSSPFPLSPFACRLVAAVIVTLCAAGRPCEAADLPFTVTWETVPSITGDTISNNKSFLLPDGRLWLSTRINNASTNRIFDPATNTWSAVPAGPLGSGWHRQHQLADGRMLQLVYSRGNPTRCAVWDPATNGWTSLPAANGDFLLAWPTADGGLVGQFFDHDIGANVWTRYAPATDDWTLLDHATTFNPDNLVLPDWDTVGSLYGSVDRFDAETLQVVRIGSAPELADNAHWVRADDRIYMRGVGNHEVSFGEVNLRTGAARTFLRAPEPVDSYAMLPLYACAVPTNVEAFGGYFEMLTEATHYQGQVRLRVFDHRDDSWVEEVAVYPTVLPTVIHWDFGFAVLPLSDGLLCCDGADGDTLRFHRLRVADTRPPPPPRIRDDLPASLTLAEGSVARLQFAIEGAIPEAGVTVRVERHSGDGDVRVVTGREQTCRFPHETYEAMIAGLVDADGDDDTAVLHLSVVQDGGAADPNTRSVGVTVTDTVTGAGESAPGDVNGDGVVNAADLQGVIDHFGTDYREGD